jgi:hypothetical protein
MRRSSRAGSVPARSRRRSTTRSTNRAGLVASRAAALSSASFRPRLAAMSLRFPRAVPFARAFRRLAFPSHPMMPVIPHKTTGIVEPGSPHSGAPGRCRRGRQHSIPSCKCIICTHLTREPPRLAEQPASSQAGKSEKSRPEERKKPKSIFRGLSPAGMLAPTAGCGRVCRRGRRAVGGEAVRETLPSRIHPRMEGPVRPGPGEGARSRLRTAHFTAAHLPH